MPEQAKHRRVRRWDVLYAVQALALRWRALARRKEVRQRALQDALDRLGGDNDDDEAVLAQKRALDRLMLALQEADTPEVRLWLWCIEGISLIRPVDGLARDR